MKMMKKKKMACTVVMGGREAKEDTTVDTVGREAKADTTPPMMVAKVEEAAFRWLVEMVDSVDTVGGGEQRRKAICCSVEMLEQKMKKKKMACTVIMGEDMVGREAR